VLRTRKTRGKSPATSYENTTDGKHCSLVIALCVPAWSSSGLTLSLTNSRRQLVHCLEMSAVCNAQGGVGWISCLLQRTMTVSFFALTGRPLALTGARVPAASAFLCSRWIWKGQREGTGQEHKQHKQQQQQRRRRLTLRGWFGKTDEPSFSWRQAW
jgi:hypothetical protein